MAYRFAIIQTATTRVLDEEKGEIRRMLAEKIVLELHADSITERLLDRIHRKLPASIAKKAEPAIRAAWAEVQDELKQETVRLIT